MRYWLLFLSLLSCESKTDTAAVTGNVPPSPIVISPQIAAKDTINILHSFEAKILGNTHTYVYLEINGMRCLQLDSFNRAGLTCDWTTYKEREIK